MAKLLDGTRIYGTANVDTKINVGTNASINTSSFNVTGNGTIATLTVDTNGLVAGNSTVTSAPQVIVANSLGNTTITTVSMRSGNATNYFLSNTTGIYTTNLLNIGNSTVNSTINSTTFTGAANNASYLGGTAAASFVQNTDSRTLSGNLTFSANITVNGVIANGSIGSSGQVLKSNGSSTYWGTDNADVGSNNQILYRNSSNVLTTSSGLVYDGVSIKVNGNLESVYSNGDEGGEIFLSKPVTNTSISGTGVTIDIFQNKLRIFENGGTNRGAYIDITAASAGVASNLLTGGGGGSGTVTSVGSGSGLTGGPITGSGTLSVLANNGITANATGVFVNQAYNYSWSGTQTFSANISFTGNNISLVTNTGSVMFAGSSDTNWRIGRNTGGTTKFYYTNNSLDIIAANSNLEGIVFGFTGGTYLETGYAGTFTLNPIFVGNSTVNTTINSTAFTGTANNASYLGGTIAAAFKANTSGGFVQNSSGAFILANTGVVVNATGVFVNAAYINTISSNLAYYVIANSGITSNSTGVFVTQGTGTVVNATGVHVNSSYIGTLSANNASYLGTVAAASYVQNTDSRTLSGNLTFTGLSTFTGNVVLNTVSANGSVGTAGQVLSSNGTTVYWANASSGGFTNGQSISVNNFVVTGAFTANGSNGTSGQVLTTNGSAIYWANAASITGVNANNNSQTFTGNGSNTIFTLTTSVSDPKAIFVMLDGLVQTPTTDYSVSGTTLTFTSTPVNNTAIEVRYIGTGITVGKSIAMAMVFGG